MGFVRKLTGSGVASAAQQGGQLQADSARESSALFEPFRQLGIGGIEQAGFLTDPQAQFDFLQSNPLFDLALDNANTQTKNMAAARGRLSAGDTLQQLSNNVLLSAQPLISSQKNSIADLLNIGSSTAKAQGGLVTDSAAAIAAGKLGGASAEQQGTANLLNAGVNAGGALAFLSDKRLKENIKKIGEEKGHNIYSWTWNKLANSLGMFGDSFGVIAQEILDKYPSAVISENGYLKVNYSMIGVNHGG